MWDREVATSKDWMAVELVRAKLHGACKCEPKDLPSRLGM